MVGLVLIWHRKNCVSYEDIEEGFVHDTLLKICDCLTITNESLLSLVVPCNDELVASVPFFVYKLVEETAMLDDKDTLPIELVLTT